MIGAPMLRLFPIIVAFIYMFITMAYLVVFTVTHSGSGWSMGAVADYALLWPLRVYRDLF